MLDIGPARDPVEEWVELGEDEVTKLVARIDRLVGGGHVADGEEAEDASGIRVLSVGSVVPEVLAAAIALGGEPHGPELLGEFDEDLHAGPDVGSFESIKMACRQPGFELDVTVLKDLHRRREHDAIRHPHGVVGIGQDNLVPAVLDSEDLGVEHHAIGDTGNDVLVEEVEPGRADELEVGPRAGSLVRNDPVLHHACEVVRVVGRHGLGDLDGVVVDDAGEGGLLDVEPLAAQGDREVDEVVRAFDPAPVG